MSCRTRLWSEARPFVCARCQVRQQSRRVRILPAGFTRAISTTSANDPGYFPPLTEVKQPAYVHLTNRSIIRLQGPDVVDFLNGLLPARIQPLPKAPVFTAFLTAKGRLLHEAFIYPPSESDSDGSWYIDVDAGSASALFSHLKKHKLRSKFRLEKISADDLGVFYTWPNQDQSQPRISSRGGQDPRPLMGQRFLSSRSEPSSVLSQLRQEGSALSISDYQIHRILCGHAEGPNELITSSALPQESNIDFDGGIDFHKGCYLGQELTIRTHHTGIVRKRILPCQIVPGDQEAPHNQLNAIYDPTVSVYQPPPEANISKMHAKGRSGRSTGKWLVGVGNVGLALCRLEMMTDIQLTAEGTNFDPQSEFSIVWEEGEADADGRTTLREVKIQPFVPQWLRDNIQAGISARSERSKRRKREEDDDEDDVD